MAPPKKDPNTIKREVALYAQMGGKSYRVKNAPENIVHFLHLGQIERHFNETSHMPLLVNTKYDLFLVNSYYDIYDQETGEHRDSTPDDSLEFYVEEYIATGFIEREGLINPEEL